MMSISIGDFLIFAETVNESCIQSCGIGLKLCQIAPQVAEEVRRRKFGSSKGENTAITNPVSYGSIVSAMYVLIAFS